jgi:hypothetical protein
MEDIAVDSNEGCTLALEEKFSGGQLCEQRVAHEWGSIKQFPSRWAPGSPVTTRG